MDVQPPQFLYEANAFISYGIPLLLVILLISPKYLTALVVMLVYLRPNERFDLPISIPTMMFPLLFIALLIHYDKTSAHKFENEDKALFILLTLIMFETILFHRQDIKEHLMGACGLGLIYYCSIPIHLSDNKGVKLLSFSILIGCFLICFEPLYYHFTYEDSSQLYQIFIGTGGRLKAWGLWGNSNETSWIACLGIATMLMLFFKEKKILYLFFFTPLLVMFVFVISLSGSRTGLGCLFLIFSVLVLTSKSKILKLLIISIIIGAIVILPKLEPERKDKEASSRERADLRYEGRRIFKEHPIFGVGYRKAQHYTGGMMIHCTYIQAFAETGIFGGSLLIYMIFIVGRRIYYGLQRNKNNKKFYSLYGALAGIYLSGLLYMTFGNQFLTIMFSTFMGFIKNYLCVIAADSEANEIS